LSEEGILAGDMVIVERGKDAKVGSIVLARFDDEFKLIIYERQHRKLQVEAVVVGLVRKYA
jgi:SOS-response transcriptional repressor LexA